MTARISRDPSPFKSALVHSTLGAFTLFGVLGAGGVAVHLTGDADAAGPAMRVALFDDTPGNVPQLNPRLPGYDEAVGFASREDDDLGAQDTSEAEPDLGVDYGGARTVRVASAQPQGIRINGQTVLPGQSLSQIQTGAALSPTTTVRVADPDDEVEIVEPVVREGTPLARYSRPFENPDGRPTVSIIVGGLGINYGRTQAAIDELPPEVTLSFSPTAANLTTWVRKARRAGHEVLIEVPMEPYDYGRLRPHPQVMQSGVDSATNEQRLNRLLSRVSGYAGVMNYQGGKFATERSAVDPLFASLNEKGLAVFEDGSLSRSVFDVAAKDENLPFGKATAWLDARPEADEISQQFLVLESAALETGSALGTGMSFPITIDLLKEWLPTLEDKGIALAPATHFAKQSLASGQVKVAALDPQG